MVRSLMTFGMEIAIFCRHQKHKILQHRSAGLVPPSEVKHGILMDQECSNIVSHDDPMFVKR